MNNQIRNSDKLSIGLTILSNALPPIGFYLSYRYRKAFPGKSRTALINAVIGIPVVLIGGYVLQTYVFN